MPDKAITELPTRSVLDLTDYVTSVFNSVNYKTPATGVVKRPAVYNRGRTLATLPVTTSKFVTVWQAALHDLTAIATQVIFDDGILELQYDAATPWLKYRFKEGDSTDYTFNFTHLDGNTLTNFFYNFREPSVGTLAFINDNPAVAPTQPFSVDKPNTLNGNFTVRILGADRVFKYDIGFSIFIKNALLPESMLHLSVTRWGDQSDI